MKDAIGNIFEQQRQAAIVAHEARLAELEQTEREVREAATQSLSPFLSRKAAAAYADVSQRTLDCWLVRDDPVTGLPMLPNTKRPSSTVAGTRGRVFIAREDLDRLLRS